MKTLMMFFLFAIPAAAHTVNLSWTVSTDDTATNCLATAACHQTVYRAAGACSATSSFRAIGTLSASQGTYADLNVTTGTYCYAVSFTLDGVESTKDSATVSLRPASPSALKMTSHT